MQYKHLTAADRGAIEALLQQNYTSTQIAQAIGRHVSTVVREIENRTTPKGYQALIAQLNYEAKRKHCKQRPKLQDLEAQKYLCRKLQLGWSPQQIAGRLKLKEALYVCPETIYQWLYTDDWAREEKLYEYLRYGRKKRKKQTGRRVQRSKIPNRVSIHLRPKIVDKKTEVGHCEGDSVIYPYKMAINTLNEVITGKVEFTLLSRKTAQLTTQAQIAGLKRLQAKSLTVDNGTENIGHQEVTQKTGIPVYFADPYSSWQRGANENCNMLLRGYLPKRANIQQFTQEELDDIAQELNNRPRKRLGYLTPNEVYNFYKQHQKLPRVAVGIRM